MVRRSNPSRAASRRPDKSKKPSVSQKARPCNRSSAVGGRATRSQAALPQRKKAPSHSALTGHDETKKAPSHSVLPQHDETETAATILSQSPTPPEDEVDLVTHAKQTNASVVPTAAVDEAVLKAVMVEFKKIKKEQQKIPVPRGKAGPPSKPPTKPAPSKKSIKEKSDIHQFSALPAILSSISDNSIDSMAGFLNSPQAKQNSKINRG